ncbi:MAG: copper chaperone PCu(A)C [Gemmatimonadota bacterium]|nr:copper chaperone PCu(A)C [Gemmatimonadota bacterium]
MSTSRLIVLAGLGLALGAAACRIVPVDQAAPAGWTHAYLVTPAPGSPAVLYLWVTNPTARADTVTGVRVTDADSAQVHRTTAMGGGMEHMVPVAALPVAAHDTVTLSPGGVHVMVFGMPAGLGAGDSAAVTVTFRNAGDVAGYARVITYAQVDSLVMR